MGTWIKYFSDGSKYEGSDEAILRHDASWTRSRNTDIIRVELVHFPFSLSIQGVGEYWQSDDFFSVMSSGMSLSKMTKRRIQKKIAKSDNFMEVSKTGNENIKIRFYSVPPNLQTANRTLIPIRGMMWDQWLVLECDLEKNLVQYHFSREKI
jgi:hypothetical protein